MVCCLSGARTATRYSQRGCCELEVIVHVAQNTWVGEVMRSCKMNIRELGKRIKGRTYKIMISGFLRVPHASENRNRKIARMDAWLTSWCREQELRCLDHWGLLWGRSDLYKSNGLYLNWRGTNILTGSSVCTTWVYLNQIGREGVYYRPMYSQQELEQQTC